MGSQGTSHGAARFEVCGRSSVGPLPFGSLLWKRGLLKYPVATRLRFEWGVGPYRAFRSFGVLSLKMTLVALKSAVGIARLGRTTVCTRRRASRVDWVVKTAMPAMLETEGAPETAATVSAALP